MGLFALVKKVLNEKDELLGFVHRAEVNILSSVAVKYNPYLDPRDLYQVFRKSADFEASLLELHDNLLLAFVEDEHIALNGEIDAYVDVFPMRFLKLTLEAFVLQYLYKFKEITNSFLFVG